MCRKKSGTTWLTYRYYLEKNLQGDVIAVYGEDGTKAVSYVYDAWGKVTETVHNSNGSNAYAQYNPFRYRSYYYDTETGFYYLLTRYYNPVWGRFINADGQLNGGLLGYNMFAYCENNPVRHTDPFGEMVMDDLDGDPTDDINSAETVARCPLPVRVKIFFNIL